MDQSLRRLNEGLRRRVIAPKCSIADDLEGKASRTYGLVEKIGSFTGHGRGTYI